MSCITGKIQEAIRELSLMPFTDLHLLIPEFTYSAFLSITKDKISALLPKAELSACIPNFTLSHLLKNNSPETDPHYIIYFTLTIASFSSVCKYGIISPILATPLFTLFFFVSFQPISLLSSITKLF